MQPALADEIEAKEKEKVDRGIDKGFELPLPEQEDLRGMTPKKDDEGESDEATAPGIVPGVGDQSGADSLRLLLPAADNVALRPQGVPQPLPVINPSQPNAKGPALNPAINNTQEDAPPPLPASLKRFASRKRGLPSLARLPSVPASMRISAGNAPHPTVNTTNRGVVPAGWQQPVGIQLINPAAALVPKATGDQLQQAIYYEATDQ